MTKNDPFFDQKMTKIDIKNESKKCVFNGKIEFFTQIDQK